MRLKRRKSFSQYGNIICINEKKYYFSFKNFVVLLANRTATQYDRLLAS